MITFTFPPFAVASNLLTFSFLPHYEIYLRLDFSLVVPRKQELFASVCQGIYFHTGLPSQWAHWFLLFLTILEELFKLERNIFHCRVLTRRNSNTLRILVFIFINETLLKQMFGFFLLLAYLFLCVTRGKNERTDFQHDKIKHIDRVSCIFTEIKLLGIIIFVKMFHSSLPVVGRKKLKYRNLALNGKSKLLPMC